MTGEEDFIEGLAIQTCESCGDRAREVTGGEGAAGQIDTNLILAQRGEGGIVWQGDGHDLTLWSRSKTRQRGL